MATDTNNTGMTVCAAYDRKEMENALVITKLVGLEGGKIAEPVFAAINCEYIHAVGGSILEVALANVDGQTIVTYCEYFAK